MRRISSKQWMSIVYVLLALNCVVAGVLAWLIFGDLLADEAQIAQQSALSPAAPTSSATPSRTPTNSPAPTLTPTFTPYIIYATATFTLSPTPRATSTATQTAAPTATATATFTALPTWTPPPTATSTPTPTHTVTPTARPAQAPRRDPMASSDDVLRPAPLRAEANDVSETSVTLRWTTATTTTFDVLSDMGTGLGVLVFRHRVQASDAALTEQNIGDDASAEDGALQYSYRSHGLQPGGDYQYLIVERASSRRSRTEPRRAWLAVRTLGVASRPRVAWRTSPGRTSAEPTQAAVTPSASSGQTPIGETPSAIPPPVASQSQVLLLSLMDTTDYVDEFGNVVIVGEVRNDSSFNAAAGQVVVTFYDARGAIIQQEQTPPLLSLLPTQQKAPFLLSVPRPPNFWDWSVRATAKPTDKYPPLGLMVTQSRGYEDEAGFYHVTGRVLNKSARKAHLAQVVVTLYNRAGKPINAGLTYTEPYTIDAGATGDFDCVFSYFPQVKNYNIQIEWD